MKQKYELGLSFAGEVRGLVEQVLECLYRTIAEDQILYDQAPQVLQWSRQQDATTFLAKEFAAVKLPVVFYTSEYYTKHNTRVEWETIRQNQDYLVLTIGGVFLYGSGIGLPIDDLTPQQICDAILRHYHDTRRRVGPVLPPAAAPSVAVPSVSPSVDSFVPAWRSQPHIACMMFVAAVIGGAVAASVAILTSGARDSAPESGCHHELTCHIVVHTASPATHVEPAQPPATHAVSEPTDHPLITQPFSVAEPPPEERLSSIDVASHEPPSPEPR